MGNLTLKINNVDKSGFLEPSTLTIVDQLDGRNTCSFRTRHATNPYKGEAGQSVEILDGATTIYKGLITDRVLEQIGGVSGYNYTYTCADYSTLATRHVIGWNYSNMQADDIVLHIVQYFLTGENISAVKVGSGGYVEPGVMIDGAIFNYISVYEALDQLAEQCGYSWYIDYDKKLHFFARGSYTAPFSLTDTTRNYTTLTTKKSQSTYRNRQYIQGGLEDSELRTERFHGDGKITQFDTMFPVSHKPTITLNGINQTVGISGIDVDKDWYWNGGSNTITQANPFESYRENILVEYDFDKVNDNKISNNGSTGEAELTLYDVPVFSDVGARYGYPKGTTTSYCQNGTKLVLPDEFTVEWVGTIESATTAFHAIINRYTAATGGWGLWVVSASGLLMFYDVSLGVVYSNTPVTIGAKCHVSVTYRKTGGQYNLKLYLNGVLNAAATVAASPVTLPTDSVNLLLGIQEAAANIHHGRAYLARVYAKELDATQVMENVLAERDRYETAQRGTRLTANDTLEVTYSFTFPIFEVIDDTAKQAAQATLEGSGTGIYEAVENDAALEDTELAQTKAQRLLEKYGIIPETINFTTYHSGLKAGQLITINLPELGIIDPPHTYLINRVELLDEQFVQSQYTVEALSGEAVGGWASFFLTMDKRGHTFAINPTAGLLLLKKFVPSIAMGATISTTSGLPLHNCG